MTKLSYVPKAHAYGITFEISAVVSYGTYQIQTAEYDSQPTRVREVVNCVDGEPLANECLDRTGYKTVAEAKSAIEKHLEKIAQAERNYNRRKAEMEAALTETSKATKYHSPRRLKFDDKGLLTYIGSDGKVQTTENGCRISIANIAREAGAASFAINTMTSMSAYIEVPSSNCTATEFRARVAEFHRTIETFVQTALDITNADPIDKAAFNRHFEG